VLFRSDAAAHAVQYAAVLLPTEAQVNKPIMNAFAQADREKAEAEEKAQRDAQQESERMAAAAQAAAAAAAEASVQSIAASVCACLI
jgi:hypothetical protein